MKYIVVCKLTFFFILSNVIGCSSDNNPTTFGGSDIPNFMTESIVEIPSSLTGEVNLSKVMINGSNSYLSSFKNINNIMKVAEASQKTIKANIESNETSIRLIEEMDIDTSFQAVNSGNYLSYVDICKKGDNKINSITFVNKFNTRDTISSISFSKVNNGYRGSAIYKLTQDDKSSSVYRISFDDTNENLKTTTIVGEYEKSYSDLHKIIVTMVESNGVLTVSSKATLPSSSVFNINERDDFEVFRLVAAVDIKQNIASIMMSVDNSEETKIENVFRNKSLVEKVMDVQYLNYVEQIFKNGDTAEKQAYLSAKLGIPVNDITKNLVDEIEGSVSVDREMFTKYLYVNKESEETGLKELYEFSIIEHPIYLNSSAEYMYDKSQGLLKHPTLICDTITVIR